MRPNAETTGRPGQLIDSLVADLAPVRPLARPGARAMLWLGAVVALGLAIVPFVNLGAMVDRLAGSADLWLAAVGSALTAALAAIAAFELALPDRKPSWALLPLPALGLWLAASGLGCLREAVTRGVGAASMRDSMDCLGFIIAFSLPLSALMIFMLRRAYALRPSLVGAMGGLAAAAAAATLLNLCHPFDSSVSDLTVHAFAVGLVILANRLTGGRLLTPPERRSA